MKPLRPTRFAGACAAATVLAMAGCAAPVTDRVILLPGPDGRTGALEVKSAKGSVRLDKAYAQVDVAGGETQAGTSSAEAVKAAYAGVLAAQPPRPRQFSVQFQSNSDQLTPDSLPVLDEMRRVLADMKAAEVVVTGHTDRVGSLEANDKLSLVRAQAVRELLVKAGVAPDLVSVAGRGEREPLVPTADEVAEARNRRVDIKLR
jgi:OmpA-OmpF porin, OOP family